MGDWHVGGGAHRVRDMECPRLAPALASALEEEKKKKGAERHDENDDARNIIKKKTHHNAVAAKSNTAGIANKKYMDVGMTLASS